MQVERRHHKRFKHEAPVNVAFKNGRGKRLKAIGVIKNISLGGMCLEIDKEISEGQPVKIVFVPPRYFIESTFDYKCKIPAKVLRKESVSPANTSYSIAVQFEHNLYDFVKERVYRPLKRNSKIFIVALVMGIILMKSVNFEYFWHQPLVNAYSIFVATYILSRFLFASFYNPVKGIDYEPSISIIIPVRNEEKNIKTSIESCFNVDYPKDKMEVIVVDDYSQDNTMKEIMEVKAKYAGLGVIAFDRHLGKRDAMAEGVLRARGDVIIFIDSDSFLTMECVRLVVQDLANPKVAAVTGRTDVHNHSTNTLTKMQTVRYYIAFQVLKSAESVFGCITCCPGCFSAYRRSCVMEVLDKWRNQKFLGVRATFGDDRSLTNYILRNHDIVYNSQAVVYTVVPDSYGQFFKQQLRWKKSWFRETLLASSFMWRKNPLMSLSFYSSFVLPLISPFVAFFSLVYFPLVFNRPFYIYIAGALLVSFVYAMFYRMERPGKIWKYGVYFCFFYMAVLAWQTYYAIVTVNRTGWGTREQKDTTI